MNGGSLHARRSSAYSKNWARLLDTAAAFAVPGNCVIALAGLHFEAFAAVKLDLAEGAVGVLVGGRVAEQVLCAQLVLDLVEGVLEFAAAVADIDHTSARLRGELVHCARAHINLTHGEILLAVGDEDGVD